MKEAVKKLRIAVKFITRRYMPFTVFLKVEEKLSLLKPGKTNFGSNFIMLD